MKILELFSGTESFSKVARERGHECFTIDIEPKFKPSLCKDIMFVTKEDIPFKPDVIWASPPCETFSMAGLKTNYTNFKPNTAKAERNLKLVLKTIEIIKVLNPKYFFIENPRAYLRKFPFMLQFKRTEVWYCRYGDDRAKPTDIWNNLNNWIGKRSKNKMTDHISAPRGSRTGTQGFKNAKERAIIPRELCLEIIRCIEEKEK